MSYFHNQLTKLSNEYGHFTGTLFTRIQQCIDAHDTFELIGNIMFTKSYLEGILGVLQSIRKECEYIDIASGSTYVKIIDRLRSILQNNTLNSFDLLSKTALRKDFESCLKLLSEAKSALDGCTEGLIELICLKDTFDLRSLPAEYIELFETGEVKYIGKIFLSYCMKEENEALISKLISPFLEELGFQTVYASRDFPPNRAPGHNAEEFIKKCGTLIAFLTKDQGVYPSANVIHEIGVASDKVVILFVEKDTLVPSNLSTSATYYTFERQNTGDVLLKTIHTLRLAKIYNIPKSK
jgi:hypothetical protein